MKLFELIEKLQKIKEVEGDIEVCDEFEALIDVVEVNGPADERYVVLMSGE